MTRGLRRDNVVRTEGDMNRTLKVQVRVTENEMEALKREAARDRRTVSDYMRIKALPEPDAE